MNLKSEKTIKNIVAILKAIKINNTVKIDIREINKKSRAIIGLQVYTGATK
jgi:hypothetical protein